MLLIKGRSAPWILPTAPARHKENIYIQMMRVFCLTRLFYRHLPLLDLQNNRTPNRAIRRPRGTSADRGLYGPGTQSSFYHWQVPGNISQPVLI